MPKCNSCEQYNSTILMCCWPYPPKSPIWADRQHRIADPNQEHDCQAFLQRKSRLQYTIGVWSRESKCYMLDVLEDAEFKECLEDFLQTFFDSKTPISGVDITVEDHNG